VPEAPKLLKNSQEKTINMGASASDRTRDEPEKATVDFENNNFFSMDIPRDPFSFFQNRQAFLNDVEIEENLCEDLLCGFDIGQLSLVAVISGDASPVAMLEDTQGTGYIVRKNSRIGKHAGRISNIYQNCLVISEPSQDVDGGVRDTALCVKSEDMNSASVDLMSNRQVQ